VFNPSRPFATFVFQDHQSPSEGDTNARGSHQTHADDIWSEKALLQEPHSTKVAMRAMCDAETAASHQNCGRNLSVTVLQL
jgi:hypothetical protein